MENRQTRLMILLAAILVGMVAAIRFIDPPEEESEDGLVDVIALSVEEVSRLTLVTAEGTLGADRTEAGWIITEPIQARADDAALEELVGMLDRMTGLAPMEGADPAKYGLDAPRAVLTLERDAGTLRLALGAEAPVGLKSYISVDGGAPQVVSGDPGSVLVRPFDAFRDRGVYALATTTVTDLRWSSGIGDWTLSKSNGGWWFDDGRRASKTEVDAMLSQLEGLQFESFAPGLSDAYAGFTNPRALLVLQDDQGEQAFRFGADRTGGVLLKSPSGVVGTISDLESLERPLAQLLETRLIGASPVLMEELTIELDGERASWTRMGDDWSRDGAEANQATGVEAFRLVAELSADRAAEPAMVGETGSIRGRSSEGPFDITIGGPVDGGRAATEVSDAPFLIPQATLDRLAEVL